MTRQPTLFIPHGGGPCFFMEWEPADTWNRMAAFLRGLAARLPEKPRAVLVISAHWEAPDFTLLTTPQPPLLYDYGGFPPHTYQLTYPASNDLAGAARVWAALVQAGIAVAENDHRGYDHGVFVPFKLIYPDADMPIMQLSLKARGSAAEHVALGRALAPLRDDGILIVGSGFSFHNLRGFHGAFGPASAAFDGALTAAVCDPVAAVRNQALTAWETLPFARQVHPHADHLLPLMVAAGAAGDDQGRRIYHDTVMGVETSGYAFG